MGDGGCSNWARWDALMAAAEKAHSDDLNEANKNTKLKLLRRNLNLFIRVENEWELEPHLPEIFRNKIRAVGGLESNISFVLRKNLTKSDVDLRQCRLMIPFKQVKNHTFLSDEEKAILDSNNKIHRVLLIDPSCDLEEMDLTRWKVTAGRRSYLLVRNWTKVVKKNDLKADDCVYLWGFRRGFQLGFALVKAFNSSS